MDQTGHGDDGQLFSRIGPQPASHALMMQQAARIAELGYFVFDVERQILEVCSERHAAIFGRTAQEFLQNASGLKGDLKMMHPDDVPAVRTAYERLMQGETIEMEYRFFRPDGSVGHVREFVTPERDASGKVRRGLGSSIDVTRSRQQDERRSRAQRLGALGELTAGVSHDFNNLLAVISGNAELAQAALKQGDSLEVAPLLREIVQAAKRGAEMTQSLLAFSQKAYVSPARLDLTEETRITVQMFERLRMKRTGILLRSSGGAVPATADRVHFRVALVNLLLNALQAVAENGRIEVSVTIRTLPESGAGAEQGDLRPGRYGVVEVADDGCGIAPEILPRVTEPFFTTRSWAEGSGLGLSTAHGFLRQSGGELLIRSKPGAGTKVSMILPLAGTGDPEDPAGAAKFAAPG